MVVPDISETRNEEKDVGGFGGVDGSLTKEAAPDLRLERAVGRLLRRIGARVHLCRGRSGLLSSMLLWLRCRPTLRAQSVPVAEPADLARFVWWSLATLIILSLIHI